MIISLVYYIFIITQHTHIQKITSYCKFRPGVGNSLFKGYMEETGTLIVGHLMLTTILFDTNPIIKSLN